MKFSVFQVSRKGGRVKNEDRMGYCYTRGSGLFVLADGMGGHPEGEVASQLAVQTVTHHYQQRAKPLISRPGEFLSDALLAAHHRLLRYAGERGMLDTPRTTLVAAVLQGNTASWVHCGDSRLYLVRDGALFVRTLDHSYLEQGAAHGHVAPEGASRHVLFTCLGSPSKPTFESTGPVKLKMGDRLLLCSDGVWGNLSDAEIVRLVASGPVSQAVPELVEMALRNGGPTSDNVTAIALEWETPDPFDSTQGISPDSIGEGEFASTVEMHELDTAGDELDDAAIERSIAEINAAIKRTAARKI